MRYEAWHSLRLIGIIVCVTMFVTWLSTAVLSRPVFSQRIMAQVSEPSLNGLAVSGAVMDNRVAELERLERQHEADIKTLQGQYAETSGRLFGVSAVGGTIAVVVGILAALGLLNPKKASPKPAP